MALTAHDQQAWQALRASSQLLYDRTSQSLSFSPGTVSRRRQRQQIYSGFSLAAATLTLVKAGWPVNEAQSTLRHLILQRFTTYAGSWNGYLAGHGYMYELDQLPPETQAEYEQRYQLRATRQAAQELADSGPMALANPAQLASTIGKLNELQRAAAVDSPERHPALPALMARHGMSPELARAVVLYQQAVPGWAIAVILFFALMAGCVFVLALVAPQNPGFQNEEVGGVGPGQLVVAPAFSLLFFAVAIWLWRDAPRRNAAWRAALETYRSSVTAAGDSSQAD